MVYEGPVDKIVIRNYPLDILAGAARAILVEELERDGRKVDSASVKVNNDIMICNVEGVKKYGVPAEITLDQDKERRWKGFYEKLEGRLTSLVHGGYKINRVIMGYKCGD